MKQDTLRRKWLVNVKEIHDAYYEVDAWDAAEAIARVEYGMENGDGSELFKLHLDRNFDTYCTDAPVDTWKVFDDEHEFKDCQETSR